MQEKNYFNVPRSKPTDKSFRTSAWKFLFKGLTVFSLVTTAVPLGMINLTTSALAQKAESGIVSIEVLDPKNNPLPNATVTIVNASGEAVGPKRTTNEKGVLQIANLPPGDYRIQVEAENFQPLDEPGIQIVANSMTQVSLQVSDKVDPLSEIVKVEAENKGNLIEQVNTQPQGQLTQQVLKTVPLQSSDFTTALPLVPNVVRPPDGKVSIKGTREDQSALLINNADATDPATGNFALSIPLESIGQVKVFTNPYLPEYGKFTGGVVKVETKPGSDKFKFEIDDFFPEPRFRGGKLFGFANASPRVHLEGPIMKEKIYFAQGLELGIDKKPVRGLASPNNELKKRFARSFSQFDFILSPKHTLTLTGNLSYLGLKHVGLDFFNPQRVAPDQDVFDYTFNAIDRLTLANGSFIETLVQYKRITSKVFGKGDRLMQISPVGREGNYYHSEERTTDRFQIAVSDTLPTIIAKGIHNVKIGVDINYLQNIGSNRNNTVELTRTDGTLAQRISYFTTGSLNATNAQVAAYVQDQWLIRRNLSFDYGLRLEAQRTTDAINLMPRLALAYSPGGSGNTVVKGAFGFFYDKVPLNAVSFENQPRQIVTTFGPDGRTILDGPRLFQLDIADRPNGKPNFGQDFAAPRNTTFTLEFNQRVNKRTLLKIAYLDSRTRNDLYVSPVSDGLTDKLVLFNNGRGRYRSLELTSSFDLPQGNALSVTYVRSKAKAELNSFNSLFGDFPDPVIRPNQFGRANSDAPNRLLARGTFKLPYQLTIVPLVEYRNGFPFSIRDEQQNYVGERNSQRYPKFFSLDMAFTKDIRVRDKYTAQFTFSLFNVTSHFNPLNVRNNINDPKFGTFFANNRRFYRVDFAFLW